MIIEIEMGVVYDGPVQEVGILQLVLSEDHR